ncbi:hypothetical protein D3C85_1687670 [compost metagenome]
MRLHAVAAQDLKLVRDDLAHRNGRGAVLAQHQADLHMLAAFVQVADRIETGDRVPQCIQ